MPFKNFGLNRIQNGRLSATIYLYYKIKGEFSGEDAPWKLFNSNKLKMADNWLYLPR